MFLSERSVENTFPRRSRRTAGPSTALRSGRDDKGGGRRFQKTEAVFHHLGWAQRPMIPLSKNISKKEHPHRDLSTALPRISCRDPWRPVPIHIPIARQAEITGVRMGACM